MKHRVFVSYHHANDQDYKTKLLAINDRYDIFIDGSVDLGDIDDEEMDDNAIRELIRDEYLMDTSVTILLVGIATDGRKHVDWEIYSSMFNGKKNKQSGIVVIMLPSTGCNLSTAPHGDDEKATIHPECQSWESCSREEYINRYPHAPDRIIDNLVNSKALISVVPWSLIEKDPEKLRKLIDLAFRDRSTNQYDLSRPMRRANS